MTTADTLSKAIKQVSELELESDNWIDNILDERRPRKRVKPTDEEHCAQLEKEFLTPSTTFSTEWLNKLQQYALSSPTIPMGPY
jgi:antiviral helicase SKI2